MRTVTTFACSVLLLFAGYAYAADKVPEGIQTRKADSGIVVFANTKGMTLYVFDQDMKGMSMCSGPCAQNWPPLMAAANAKQIGDWTMVNRDGGAKQWAYKGKPVYTYVKDSKAGDTTGDGAGKGVWHIAVP